MIRASGSTADAFWPKPGHSSAALIPTRPNATTPRREDPHQRGNPPRQPPGLVLALGQARIHEHGNEGRRQRPLAEERAEQVRDAERHHERRHRQRGAEQPGRQHVRAPCPARG